MAPVVWEAFGDVQNYVEPFAGSLAVLLGRPTTPKIETINDLDCYVANFWRALAAAPLEVARWADWPVNEADLHARHQWLVLAPEVKAFRERMKTDPDFFDAKIAGWWVWGICQWIGTGWCLLPEDAAQRATTSERGLRTALARKRPVLGKGTRGVQGSPRRTPTPLVEQRPELSAPGRGVHRSLPSLGGSRGAAGHGIHASALTRTPRKRPQLKKGGMGVHHGLDTPSRKLLKMDRGTASRLQTEALVEWMERLADRLRRVRVCCGDWSRVLGPSPTVHIGVTGVFLDPPYSGEAGRDPDIYSSESLTVAHDVRAWCLANGHHPKLRIALCGYEGEHELPGWTEFAWKAAGGYGKQANAVRERIWFSPHCFPASTRQGRLFG